MSQIVFKQFHIIIHTVLIRLLHQGAKLLLFSPRWMEYHQGVKVDSRVCVLLCNICQAAIDAKLERQQLYHTRTPLRDEVELTPANLHQEEERPIIHEHLRHQHCDRLEMLYLQAAALGALSFISPTTHTFITLIASSRGGKAIEGRCNNWLYSMVIPLS